MPKKPKILVFIGCYLPGYRFGGPVQSIANMVSSLQHIFDFYIVTLDRDLGDLVRYPNIETNKFIELGGCKICYLPREGIGFKTLNKIIYSVSPGLIYLNGFFSPLFNLRIFALAISGKICVPLLLAPRGEFSEGALSLKPLKKRIYLWVFRKLHLHKSIYWHATNRIEKNEIQSILGKGADLNIHTASNIPRVPESLNSNLWSGKKRELTITFLSRISPKKNLHYAIEIISKLTFPVRFDIYGTLEDKVYWDLCQKSIQQLNANIKVTYFGELRPKEVVGVLSQYDVFLLPTKGENFGHVIYEALSAGTILLISDRTPWNKIEEAGAGWCLSLTDSRKFIERLSSVRELDEESMRKMRHAAISFAQTYGYTDLSDKNTKEMFSAVLQQV